MTGISKTMGLYKTTRDLLPVSMQVINPADETLRCNCSYSW